MLTFCVMSNDCIYRITFMNQGEVYEIYARNVGQAEMFAFIDLVLGRAPNPCPPEDARAAFVAALAAGRSVAEGRPVLISEFG